MSQLNFNTNQPRKKYRHLTYEDRQKLEGMVKLNKRVPRAKRVTQKVMAEALGCSEATMSRELKRGKVVVVDSLWQEYISYSAELAQANYDYEATGKGPGIKTGMTMLLQRMSSKRSLRKSGHQMPSLWI